MFPVDGVANGTGKRRGVKVERVEILLSEATRRAKEYYPNLDREASGTDGRK